MPKTKLKQQHKKKTTKKSPKKATKKVVNAEVVKSRFGRPTKWKGEQTLLEVEQYLDSCQDKFEEMGVESDNEKTGRKRYLNKLKAGVPTMEGLSLHLGIAIPTIKEWEAKHKEFSNAIKELKAIQKERLFLGGLSGLYNPLIVKLGLSANHGMNEKTEVDNTYRSRELEDLSDEELRDELLRLREENPEL